MPKWVSGCRLRAASDQPPPLLVVFQVEGAARGAVLYRQRVGAHGQRLGLCKEHKHNNEARALFKVSGAHLPRKQKSGPGQRGEAVSVHLPALGTCRSIFTSKSWTLNKSSERSVVGLGTSLSFVVGWPCDRRIRKCKTNSNCVLRESSTRQAREIYF